MGALLFVVHPPAAQVLSAVRSISEAPPSSIVAGLARAKLIPFQLREPTMKTLALLGAAAIAIACDSPTSPRALLKTPTTLSNAIVYNDRVESVAFLPNNCNGDLITGTGTFHDLFALTGDGAGGVHVKFHDDFHGKGSDPVSGVDYIGADASNSEFNAQVGFESTSTLHYNLIAKGNAPNVTLAADFHITMTPNGDVTSFHDHFRLVCQ